MTRPFRFGVFGENARSREALLDTARRAEDAGYSTFLIRDHFIEEPFGHQLAPLASLTAVAGATSRLRVGSLVLSNDYRHPVMLDGFPKPVQRPRPPLLIGAAGKRMLSIAAREADIIGFQTVSTAKGVMADDPSGRLASAVAQRVEQVRQGAGERFRGIELSMVASVVFAEQRRQAADQLARDRGWTGISAEQVLEMPSVFVGSLDCIVDEMRARRERYGFSYYVVLDQAMEKVAPIVARLAGT
jgi:alkanesulfonate monooxygenase SsuD/methylene tetrahydromethanopterin reductase-like flavin-dependent oxidoreductase (luciferase family)